MILPPIYFPVYQLHVRLVDPGLHAQPLIESPPVPHAEGIHTVQWLKSDPTKLTSTVSGDMQHFALRDFDSGPFIPHIPVPLMAGPYLVDTLKNSHYTIVFYQPNVKMDSTEVGIFFWGLAMPWICSEIKLPIPKFLARRASAALSKVASSKLSKALDKVSKAADALDDALDSSADADAISEKAEAYHAAQDEKKKAEAYGDSKKLVNDEEASDRRVANERAAEKQANQDKRAADHESRASAQEAEQHEAAARAHRDKAEGATGGTTEDSMQAERDHRAAADSQRNMAEREQQRADVHDSRAASHRQEQAQAQERSRQASADADYHEAMAQEENERAAGVRSGGSPESMDKADQHAALAEEHRERARAEARDAEQHGAQADAHDRARTSALDAADSGRRQAAEHEAKADAHANRVEADRRQAQAQRARQKSADAAQRSKQAQAKAAAHRSERADQKQLKKAGQVELSQKHGKINPYKQATGMGNTSMLLPSLLAHVPFPATVQIYMSWFELLRNWGKALMKVLIAALNGYVGFLFDSVLGPGKKGVAKWLVDTGKSLVSGTILGGVEKFVVDDKVEVKVSTKFGPVSVSLTLDQDQKTKEWTWNAKADGSKELGKTGAKGSVSASASGDVSSTDGASPDASANDSHVKKWSVDAKAESSKPPASIDHTWKSSGESETTAEVGHHKLDNAGSTPLSGASPAVDYGHGSSMVP